MKIKRSIKESPGREKSGTVEFITEDKMKEIILNCYPLGAMGMGQNRGYGVETALERLASGTPLETHYAKYEKVT